MDLENFPPSHYANVEKGNPGPQNWNIVQDKQGIIYISNTRGILSFDGYEWRLVKDTENLNRASIALAPDGTIYAANLDEIGYFQPDSSGALAFISLKKHLPDPLSEGPDIKWLRTLGKQIYFIGEHNVLFWDEASQQFYVWESSSKILESFVWGQKLLLWLENKGIFQLKPTGLEQYWPIESMNPPVIKSVVPLQGRERFDESIVIFTQDDGMYQLHENRLVKPQNELNRLFPNLVIWDAIILSTSYLAVATNNNGILIIDKNGNLHNQIDKRSGLAVNGAIALFEDQAGSVWAGLDVGIARVNPLSRLNFWGSAQGLEGTTMSVWASDQEVLVATTAGLFKADIKYEWDRNFSFTKLDVTQLEVWNIVPFGDLLLLATSEGVFTKKGNTFSRITPNLITMSLFPSSTDSSLVYVGLYEGLARLRRTGTNRWAWERISGIDHQVRSLMETEGYVWAANRKLSRIDFQNSPPEILTLEAGNGFPDKVQLLDLFIWKNRLFMGTWMGIMEFEESNRQLTKVHSKDDVISTFGKPVYPVVVDNKDQIWFYSQPKAMAYILDTHTEFKLDSFLLNPIHQDVWSITESHQKLWFGTSQGVFRYQPTEIPAEFPAFNTLIRKVSLNEDSTIFWGNHTDRVQTLSHRRNGSDIKSFPHSVKEINITFSASWYSNSENNQFRYRLIGFDPEWSDWKRINEKSYTGLREGRYIFEVEAKNSNGQKSQPATYTFIITPPWFRQPWAYGLYLLFAMGVFFVLVGFQNFRHRKKLQIKEKELARERETAARLRQIDKLKDEFLANTSHELRTPLNGIIGIAESLTDGIAGPVTQRLKDNLNMIIGSGKRLSSLVDDILDFSKLKSRELVLNKKAVDLHALTQVVLKNCEPMVQGKDIMIRNDIPKNLHAVYGDESRLIQVLFNLVGNAIKFTEKGYVSLMAVQQGNQILVSISDTGIGIPHSMQQKIFESFEQGDGSATRTYGGTGLGLTISRQLIELHGGSLSVKSTPGKGSTFYFTLPATEEAAETPGNELESPQLSEKSFPLPQKIRKKPENVPPRVFSPATTTHILVVDDDPINQQVLENQLSLQKYKVSTASSGKEALQLLTTENAFDLVLLDIMMPQMSGYEVCEEIRKSWLPSELPVIMLTAKNQVSDLVQGLTVGANDYISKPFSKDEFLARIKTHLNLLHINRSTGRFLPIEFLHALGKESIVDVQLGDQVEKEVTVMFADIRSYTTLAENLSPGETFNFLNEYLGRVGPVIKKNKGFVNQYYGDGIMALFLESPLDALQTAYEMMASINEMNTDRERLKLMPIRIGIGIHMGPLMMGIIGDEQRMDASVVSDTVNTASRLEGLTKYYRNNIILSSNVIQALPSNHHFQFRYMGEVLVKGRKNRVEIYDCFSSDKPELKLGKSQTLDTFQTAVNLYFNQSFEQSAEFFKKILQEVPQDNTSKLFLRKCEDEIKLSARRNKEEFNS